MAYDGEKPKLISMWRAQRNEWNDRRKSLHNLKIIIIYYLFIQTHMA